MSKLLISVAALFSLLTWAVPTYAQSNACISFCQQRCGGKGGYCMINCQQRAKVCQQSNPSQSNPTGKRK